MPGTVKGVQTDTWQRQPHECRETRGCQGRYEGVQLGGYLLDHLPAHTKLDKHHLTFNALRTSRVSFKSIPRSSNTLLSISSLWHFLEHQVGNRRGPDILASFRPHQAHMRFGLCIYLTCSMQYVTPVILGLPINGSILSRHSSCNSPMPKAK